MHSVESIAAEIVRREGGYVNDPDDPGARRTTASPSRPCSSFTST